MTDKTTPITLRLEETRGRIARAAARAGRDPASIHLLAVSKHNPAEAVAALAAAGQSAFGESYVQEALEKVQALAHLGLEWHFIGPLQSNKTRPIAEHFAWVHSVDRLKLAERLSAQRPDHLDPLNICLQVNISAEPSKSGIPPSALPALADAVAELPRLTLRGLMCIPAPMEGEANQRAPFAAMAALAEQLRGQGHPIDTLSMGMSDDLEAAILEGATWVRIGTALFGPRT